MARLSLAASRRPAREPIVAARQEPSALDAPNQAWCMDFAVQRLENGRQARILAVLDCFTRELLLLKAAPSFPSFQVHRELEWLFLVNGRPKRIVSDNGPEFRALRLPEDVEPGFIQPGKPWQNGFVESFFDKQRDELLRQDLFSDGAELQASLEEFQVHYNHFRPHRSLGHQSPAKFKEGLKTNPKEAELTL